MVTGFDSSIILSSSSELNGRFLVVRINCEYISSESQVRKGVAVKDLGSFTSQENNISKAFWRCPTVEWLTVGEMSHGETNVLESSPKDKIDKRYVYQLERAC